MTMLLIRDSSGVLFWLCRDRDVRDYVRNCKRCIVSNTVESVKKAPLESIKSTRPLRLVCIDFWSAEDSRNKTVDVLIVTDHFTRMAQAFPYMDQSAKQVARVLCNKLFCVFGFPEQIHSDQGANFESQLISELLTRGQRQNLAGQVIFRPSRSCTIAQFTRKQDMHLFI